MGMGEPECLCCCHTLPCNTCPRGHVICTTCSSRFGHGHVCFFCDPSISQSETTVPEARASIDAENVRSRQRWTVNGVFTCTVDGLLCVFGSLLLLFLAAIVGKCILAAGFSLAGITPAQWARSDDPVVWHWFLTGGGTMLIFGTIYDGCTGWGCYRLLCNCG
jgi:hypothetical protein